VRPTHIAAKRREVEMLELGLLVLVVGGALWLFGALVIGVFKLTFGLLAALFGGLFGMFALVAAALLVLPVVLFALLPVLLPVLFVAGLVWLIVHASRTRHEPGQPAQGEVHTG
jgi:hypothetical protein